MCLQLAWYVLAGFNWSISPTMHGTLLDQRVFESLVARCLPMIHDYFLAVDVQLSVASLPWFLSLSVYSLHTPVPVHQLIHLPKLHQQYADGIRLSDSGLFLLHGPESAVSSWVRFLAAFVMEPITHTSPDLVSVFDPDQTTSYFPQRFSRSTGKNCCKFRMMEGS